MKRNRTLLIALGVAAVAVGLALAGCNREEGSNDSTDSLAEVMQQGQITVGYIVFPPTITKDPNTGELGGHFVRTMNEIADQADWEVEYVETTWADFAAGLSSGRFDLSIAPTFVTIPRAKVVAFTAPLFYAGNSAIVRHGENRFSDINSMDQEGITVAVTQGEAGYEYATENFTNATVRVFPVADQTLTFQSVLSGQADVALGDAYVTEQFAKEHPDEIVDLFADDPYNLTPVSWALPLGSDTLLPFINASIEALDAQGKLLDYEREAGANWLHVERGYVLTSTL